MRKENPFQVPEDFFERQQAKIKERIAADQQTKKSRTPIISLNSKYVLAIAGIAAVLVLYISIFQNGSSEDADLFQEITFEQLMTETPEFVYSLNDAEMMEILFSGAAYSVNEVFDQQFISDSALYNESILNYLVEEEISSEFLYN